ncbi:sirohydrochlorin ferrochelatase [Murinocardiopsis flavida]|uniref:Sirohydrochlorin ferrochelatase n=1 Tax=Murinocardiopsis flavida TaxID=645275 RepID=A0A2P8DLU8_9ACTN|nr:sirohydrochlorin chelatase [Murinocardiopsis flavida]PSK98175.1 sirohydrochlorin ferrochelatase [Murinocardiopsis flavida]
MSGHGAPVPLVAVAHGSRDERSAQAVEALFARVRRLRPDVDVRVAYLDHVSPSPAAALADLAGRGAGEVVVLPALLTAAFHSKTDLPAALAQVRADYPWLKVRYGDTLGPHPLLLDAVERRLAQAGAAAAPDTGLVLVSAGSSDPEANGVIASMADALAARAPWHSVVPAYASAAAPAPGRAVAALRDRGAARVAVAGYLLAPGFFADRVADQAFAEGAAAVSAPLGDAPELARVALQRYEEALRTAPVTVP